MLPEILVSWSVYQYLPQLTNETQVCVIYIRNDMSQRGIGVDDMMPMYKFEMSIVALSSGRWSDIARDSEDTRNSSDWNELMPLGQAIANPTSLQRDMKKSNLLLVRRSSFSTK